MAKEVIKKTLIGFGLFLGSWLVVFTVLKLLSVNTTILGNGEHWYDFSCDTSSPFQTDYQNQDEVDSTFTTFISITSPSSMSSVNAETIIKFTDSDEDGAPYYCVINEKTSTKCISGTTKISDLDGWDDLADGDSFTLTVVGSGISSSASSLIIKQSTESTSETETTTTTTTESTTNDFVINSPTAGSEVDSDTIITFTDPRDKSPYLCEITYESNIYYKDNCVSGVTTFGNFEKWADIIDGANFSLAIISTDSDSGNFLPEKTDSITLKKKSSDVTDYTYQTGISEQLADASAALTSLLDCMKDKLSDDTKVISSISDGDDTDYDNDNNTTESLMSYCTATYTNPPCEHAENSCHYGGVSCKGKSYAVDFANESYLSEIKSAATTCVSGAYVLEEGDHIHVSIGSINGCGCN